MTETTPDQDRLLDEAIDLIIRYQNDPDNSVTAEMIRTWRARGPLQEEAWARISKVHGTSGTLLNEKRRIERRESLQLTRRNLTLGGIAMIGAGAAAYSLGPNLLVQVQADYMTAKGEVRQLTLPDGSMATLGPQSAIALKYHDIDRTVELLAGMAFFEVAPDPARPFSVLSGSVKTTALGTAFDISDDAGILTLSVDHGVVEFRADASASTALRLSDREWISVDPASGRVDRGQREAGQVASWRDKLIIAERETVSALVARISRWVPGRVVLADPFIGRQRVSGVFDLNDPVRALQAVVHPAGARLRQISDLLTLISPV